jgi:hypothetical protein
VAEGGQESVGDGREGQHGYGRPPWFAWALGAVLAACGPSARLMQFLTANRAEIARPEVVMRTAVVSSVMLVALALAWSAWSRRSPVITGAVLGVFGFFFFAAGIFGSGAGSRLVWFAIVVGLCAVAAASAAQRTWVASTVAVLGIGYIAFAGAAYADWRGDQGSGIATVHSSDAVPAGTLPNVYYVVLDGYARDDVVRTLFPDDDASAFNDTMAELGFKIDPGATANYPQTDQSVPSTLDQALILDERTPVGQVRQDRSRMLKGANETVASFRELGYHYVQTDGRRHDALGCDQALADGCLGPSGADGGVSLGQVERSLVELTPVGPIVLGGGIIDQEGADIWPADVVDGLIGDAWLTGDRPIFVYAHIIAPHPPYVRDGECDDIDPVGNLGEGWGPEHLPYYHDQLRCLRTELSQSLQRLVEADPAAIVLVQSDHGPGFGLDLSRPLDNWTDEMLRTRFGAFRSWRMPEACFPTDEAASSLVNTFRVVEACVRAETPELVEAQSYLVGYGSSTVEALPPGIIAPAPGS